MSSGPHAVSEHWCPTCMGIDACTAGAPPSRSPRCDMCGAPWPADGRFCGPACKDALTAEVVAANAAADALDRGEVDAEHYAESVAWQTGRDFGRGN